MLENQCNNLCHWFLLPVIFKASVVKTQDSAEKNDEWYKLNEHCSYWNHMSMPKNDGNSYATYTGYSSQKFSGTNPPATHKLKRSTDTQSNKNGKMHNQKCITIKGNCSD